MAVRPQKESHTLIVMPVINIPRRIIKVSPDLCLCQLSVPIASYTLAGNEVGSPIDLWATGLYGQ